MKQLAEVPRFEFRHGRHPWCQPGDVSEQTWILQFCDPDVRDMVFTGPDAEAQAWAMWDRYAPSWNCTLFRAAAQYERPIA